MKLLFLLLGGGAGTAARFLLVGYVQRVIPNTYLPWATIAVNLAGCLFFGLVWALAERYLLITPALRTGLLIGFAGAFTTFSTVVFETGMLLHGSQWIAAALYLGGQLTLGLLLMGAGVALGRML